MPRWFNVAGPCRPEIHYMLPATERLPEVERLVEQQQYFVLHAPRQTGKTTAMLEFGRQLTASGRYTAVIVRRKSAPPLPTIPARPSLLCSMRGVTILTISCRRTSNLRHGLKRRPAGESVLRCAPGRSPARGRSCCFLTRSTRFTAMH